jgi:peptidoglycan/xylan/chitin deacetylase (PgdA/CDA1 family)
MKTSAYLYHDVTEDDTSSGFQNPVAYEYTHRIDHFTSDLDAILASMPSTTVAPKPEMSAELPSSNDLLLFTFDDGGASAMDIADIIEERDLRGYFFMTTSRIGSPEFLSKEQLRELVARGHVVGTHTHAHSCPFSRLPYDRVLEEWTLSKNILEEILGRAVLTGSIPGGAMNQNTFRAAHEAGLRLLFTSRPTHNVSYYKELSILGRMCPKRTTSIAILKQFVASPMNILAIPWDIKSMLRRVKYAIQKTDSKPT